MELFKDWLPSITTTKQDIFEEPYPAFMINRALSMREDTILLANEMNCSPHLSSRSQYLFYLNTVPKKKNYSQWAKSDKPDINNIIMEMYNVSFEKSQEIIRLLSETQINHIKEYLDKGGTRNDKSERHKNNSG